MRMLMAFPLFRRLNAESAILSERKCSRRQRRRRLLRKRRARHAKNRGQLTSALWSDEVILSLNPLLLTLTCSTKAIKTSCLMMRKYFYFFNYRITWLFIECLNLGNCMMTAQLKFLESKLNKLHFLTVECRLYGVYGAKNWCIFIHHFDGGKLQTFVTSMLFDPNVCRKLWCHGCHTIFESPALFQTFGISQDL